MPIGTLVLAVAGIVAGGICAIAGLIIMKRPDAGRTGAWAARLAALVPFGLLRSSQEGASEPTRLTVGVGLMLLGYHVAAWASPDPWFPVKIPPDRWWMLATGLLLAAGVSVAADKAGSARAQQLGHEHDRAEP